MTERPDRGRWSGWRRIRRAAATLVLAFSFLSVSIAQSDSRGDAPLGVIRSSGREHDFADELDRLRLVAIDPSGTAAVLGDAEGALRVVRAGDEISGFVIAAIGSDRVGLRRMERGAQACPKQLVEVWLPAADADRVELAWCSRLQPDVPSPSAPPAIAGPGTSGEVVSASRGGEELEHE